MTNIPGSGEEVSETEFQSQIETLAWASAGLLVLVVMVLFFACHSGAKPTTQTPSPPVVEVAPVEQRDVRFMVNGSERRLGSGKARARKRGRCEVFGRRARNNLPHVRATGEEDEVERKLQGFGGSSRPPMTAATAAGSIYLGSNSNNKDDFG